MPVETRTIASAEDWRAALHCAAAVLELGANGAYVRRGESWCNALVREALAIIVEAGECMKRGARDEWAAIATAVSLEPSRAPDGMVQCWDGFRLPIAALPATPPPRRSAGPSRGPDPLRVVRVPSPAKPCGRAGCSRRIDDRETAWCWSDERGTFYHSACATVRGAKGATS